MASGNSFVPLNVTRRVNIQIRVKAFFCGLLSIIWLLVAVVPALMLWDGFPAEDTYLKWLCVAMVVPEPVWIILTVVFWRFEKPSEVTESYSFPCCSHNENKS